MTNYTRSSEDQREDAVLKDCIAKELAQHRKDLERAAQLMLQAYVVLAKTTNVDEREPLITPTGVRQAQTNLYADSKRLQWKADFLGTISDTYLGNLAVFMSPEQAERLKAKYSD